MFWRSQARKPSGEVKLRCPQCSYSLEGHSGYVVTCPECGAMCDVKSIVDPHGDMRWTDIPGATDLVAPLWWLAVSLMLALPVFALARGTHASVIGVVFGAVIVPGGWLVLCVRGVHKYRGSHGLLSLLLLHGACAAVLIGGVGALGAVTLMFVAPFSADNITALSGIGIVVGMLLVACAFALLTPLGLFGASRIGRGMVRSYRREYLASRRG